MSDLHEKILVEDRTLPRLKSEYDKNLARYRCFMTMLLQKNRVLYFVRRISERGETGKDMVILIMNVNDPLGKEWADDLMPGENWQAIRDRGDIPVARGLATRATVEPALLLDGHPEAHAALKAIEDVAVLVIDFGIIAVFDAREL